MKSHVKPGPPIMQSLSPHDQLLSLPAMALPRLLKATQLIQQIQSTKMLLCTECTSSGILRLRCCLLCGEMHLVDVYR